MSVRELQDMVPEISRFTLYKQFRSDFFFFFFYCLKIKIYLISTTKS